MTDEHDIGIDVEAPSESCSDENCPFHGELPVRGKVATGTVASTGMEKTAVVTWEYAEHIPKYERYERRNTKVSAHHPPCIDLDEGDTVTIAECRPLSKTKRFVVVERTERDEA